MADKRMFSKSVVESDAFYDMPTSTQTLYFHFNMNADDEGFVENPKNIMTLCKSSPEDLRILGEKNFIIMFESKIIVIKHWKINNNLRSDRFKPTNYIEEKNMLYLKPNKAYTLDYTKGLPLGIPTDNHWYAQYSRVENIVEEINIGEISIEDKEILKQYICNSGEKLIPATATTILSLIKNFGKDFFEEALKVAVIRKNVRIDYIIGILDSWKNKGFKTIDDIKQERKNSNNENCEYQKNQQNDLSFLYEN